MKATCSVVILFEEAQAREKAVKFCDQLVERFWAEREFNLTWLPFSALSDPDSAREAHVKAYSADMIVFATRPEIPVPPAVTDWVARCLANRRNREGTLAAVIDSGPVLQVRNSENDAWLRNLAHRAGMDYLTEVPQNIDRPIPDSLDSYSERARYVTSLLHEILHQPAHPPTLR